MKEEDIVRYSDEEIRRRVRRGETKTDWARINGMTEEEIERNALEEDRRLGIPDDWLQGRVRHLSRREGTHHDSYRSRRARLLPQTGQRLPVADERRAEGVYECGNEE